jgi:photosystem II cytochrome c550
MAVFLTLNSIVLPAAAAPDPYIAQYLKVQPDEIATIVKNASGDTQDFDYNRLLQGKTLFGQNCQSCHVGGATLSRPELPLSLAALQGATPPRDTLDALVTYMRHPLGYDGEDDNYGCREIKEAWLNQPEVETIAAFVLRAAEKAAGWGTSDLF